MLELDQNLLVEIGGWPAPKEARALVERGRVREVQRDGAIIRAKIQGAEKVYDAQITLADRAANVEVRCTCAESRRSGRVCAHVLAAGLALLQPKISVGSRRSPSDEIGGHRPPLQGEQLSVERPRIIFSTHADGALELVLPKGTRVIPHAQIADFLTREFPALERSCELVFAPGFEEFRLDIGQPVFEARLEGALSGLALELI